MALCHVSSMHEAAGSAGPDKYESKMIIYLTTSGSSNEALGQSESDESLVMRLEERERLTRRRKEPSPLRLKWQTATIPGWNFQIRLANCRGHKQRNNGTEK